MLSCFPGFGRAHSLKPPAQPRPPARLGRFFIIPLAFLAAAFDGLHLFGLSEARNDR